MKIGKLPNEVLERIVFKNITNKRKEVITRAGIGEDCAVIDFEKYGCVVSTDPITGASHNIGRLAVHISCNDVASNGAEPIGVLLTILVPEGTREEDIERIMKDAGETSKEINVEIMGGHTEVTNAVNKVVITSTVIGMQPMENVLRPNTVKVGDKILMTKTAGIEGTSIIVSELENQFKDKISDELIIEAKKFIHSISVVEEGKICGQIGVKYMHDVTEGGILGAIWESAKAIGKGVKVDIDSIPIADSTREICRLLNINPLRLISSGSMIIISKEEKVEIIKRRLSEKNIGVTVIGEVIEDGIFMIENGTMKEISPPDSDELYKVI